MKFLKSLAAGAALVALVATPAVAMLISRVPLVPDDSQLPGRHADGSVQLINQRTITPAGQQSDLGDLPLNAILSPDGKRLLVSNSGAGVQSLEVVDTSSGKILQETKYLVADSVFIGLTYSPDGKKMYASGGPDRIILHRCDGSARPGFVLGSNDGQCRDNAKSRRTFR